MQLIPAALLPGLILVTYVSTLAVTPVDSNVSPRRDGVLETNLDPGACFSRCHSDGSCRIPCQCVPFVSHLIYHHLQRDVTQGTNVQVERCLPIW